MSCIINWALFIIISLWLELFSPCNWGNANSNTNLWFSKKSNWGTSRRNTTRPGGTKPEDMKHGFSFYSLFCLRMNTVSLTSDPMYSSYWLLGSLSFYQVKLLLPFGKWSHVSLLRTLCSFLWSPRPCCPPSKSICLDKSTSLRVPLRLPNMAPKPEIWKEEDKNIGWEEERREEESEQSSTSVFTPPAISLQSYPEQHAAVSRS